MSKEKHARLELASKIARVTGRSNPHEASVERRTDNKRAGVFICETCQDCPQGRSGADSHSEDGCFKLCLEKPPYQHYLHSDTQISLARVKISLGRLSLTLTHKMSFFLAGGKSL